MRKNHEAPEFQVIKQNEANAKFFVASESFYGSEVLGLTPSSTTNYVKNNSNGWF